MEVIKPSFEILTKLDYSKILKTIELAGRTAYKSEGKITEDSAAAFVVMIIGRGHESVLEHESFSVKFICDRGVSHELVRHRLVAYTQESTRYCNYYRKGITFIQPNFWNETSKEDEQINFWNETSKEDEQINFQIWYDAMKAAENYYNKLIKNGATPEEARSVLPNSLKTEIIATANIREWRHILTLRASTRAHPQMREVMVPLLKTLKRELPVLFEDIPLAVK